ncbi:MAG: patatin-like phospholipase RssA [Gammaproteobacteria bacterium]|nr:patatin-like phospholipase RssA [Gammaproteobacteria bacterium]MDH5729749.1 patatin-like phospholipase RssA [Gammaproteobacteria bacterium]
MSQLKLGIALGSGAARGWSHIGVLEALAAESIHPNIICGSSIGSLVSAAYAADKLAELKHWVLALDKRFIFKLADISLFSSGSLIEGKKLIAELEKQIGEFKIENMPKPFACVATDLQTGREIWLRQGDLWSAVRASMALPGMFAPVRKEEHWLVDGGLVNPVPVSLCRAMGADIVIAVNLNSDIVGKHFAKQNPEEVNNNALVSWLGSWMSEDIRSRTNNFLKRINHDDEQNPSVFDVMASAINIMQDRITRSRMGGDPPDLSIRPQLSQVNLLDFDRGEELIEAGFDAVQAQIPFIKKMLNK